MIRAITEAIHPDIEFEYPALITLRDEVENIVVQVMQSESATHAILPRYILTLCSQKLPRQQNLPIAQRFGSKI